MNMKRVIYKLLVIFTALLMWSCNAFAQGKAPAPIDTAKIFSKVRTVFTQFNSATDLARNIGKVKKVDNQHISNVTFDSKYGTMTVTLINNDEKTFFNPLLIESASTDTAIKEYKAAANKRIDKTVWIGNGLHYDSEFSERTIILQDLAQRLCDIGFDVTYTPTWNDELLFKSDIILYHGHGAYTDSNGMHWINTGINNYKYSYERPLGMEISEKGCYSINEEYINSKRSSMKRNACVYLACCDLLNGSHLIQNETLAMAFTRKNAAAVIAYWDNNYLTAIYGAIFLDKLAMGKSIGEAYHFLRNDIDSNVFEEYVSGGIFKKFKEELGREIRQCSFFFREEYKIILRNNDDKLNNIVYNDVVGREELTRLYNLLNGDSWDDAAKKNWLSDLPVSRWAGVSVSQLSSAISVTINSGNLNLPADLTLENFNRIEKITLPKDSRVNNLTIQNCKVLTHNPVIACNNLKIKGCPALYGIKLNGAKNVSIDDCEVLKELVISDALEVESLTVSNCKSLNSFECRSVSYSGKPESSLKSLSFKDCDILARVDIHGCPISGTLDLSNCKGLKDVSISVTNIQQIKVGELESLSVRETPIKQTYESLPGVKNFYVQPKYMYTRMSKFKDEEKIPDAGEGFQYVGDLEDEHYYYKLNFDDGSGFYHKDELIDPKYWNINQITW